MTKTYTLSIEPVEGKTFQYGFHLGTDLKLAKLIAVEKFHARNNWGMPTRTVALLRGGKIIDVYDGTWDSDFVWECNQQALDNMRLHNRPLRGE